MIKKKTSGAFLQLMQGNHRFSAWDSFLHDIRSDVTLKHDEFDYAKRLYNEILNDRSFRTNLFSLFVMETILLQIHCMNDPEIKVRVYRQSKQENDYAWIIACARFYLPRMEHRSLKNEIRVYIDKLSNYGGRTIEELRNDTYFMSMVKKKTIDAMLEEMQVTKKFMVKMC